MNKKERLADFQFRMRSDPLSVREFDDSGRFVTINPMADEVELLASLDLQASGCIKVDLYWEIEGDIAFVQVQTLAYTKERPVGMYGRMMPTGHINYVVVTPESEISTGVVEDALAKLGGLSIDEASLSSELRRF